MLDFITKEKASLGELKQYFDCKVMINHEGDSILTNQNGLGFEFGGDAFRQVNDMVAESLYEEVLEKTEGRVVLNAYSGAGVLSGLLAKKAKKVYGIELSKSAHYAAESLKALNHLDNLENICGFAEREIHAIEDTLDFAVVDPPRAGCDKDFLEAILINNVASLIYISCNPSTLVRDLKILSDKYEISSVKIFDMFPRTANMETLVLLRQKDLTK